MSATQMTINGKTYYKYITDRDFIKVPITEEMRRVAYKNAEVAKNFNNTFMSFDRRKQGFLGEQVFKSVFPEALPTHGNYHYDFIFKGMTWEVKTKVCIPPRLHHNCSVYGYNPNQQSDLLVFIFVEKGDNPQNAWIVGYTRKTDFDNNCVFVKKGSELQAGLLARTDTWNVLVNKLYPMKNFL